ncbi:hypothetical protein C8Q78DRAFT_991023 [Trametes maxima]|nr:hypothetical protein C8Q78DRAFT_991023 [Trametes maxima]
MAPQSCRTCGVVKELKEFDLMIRGPKKGQPSADCRCCVNQRKKTREEREKAKRTEDRKWKGPENSGEEEGDDGDGWMVLDGGEPMALGDFLEEIPEVHTSIKVRARVDLQDIVPLDAGAGKCADALCNFIEERMGLYWMFEKRERRIRTGGELFSYSCAQSADREHKAKVPKGKPRATRHMARFECHAWLRIAVRPDSHVLEVKMKHDIDHIWNHIVAEETEGVSARDLNLAFNEKSVYYYWSLVGREEWRLADNPLESAREFVHRNGAKYQIKELKVDPEPGMETFSFYVTDFMEEWGQHTQELAMDSMCECTYGGDMRALHAAHAHFEPPLARPIPCVRLLVAGRPPAPASTPSPEPETLPPSPKAVPKLVFQPQDIERALRSPQDDSDTESESDGETFFGSRSRDAEEIWESEEMWEYDEWEGLDDPNDIRHLVDRIARREEESEERTHPSSGAGSTGASYQFCPPPHRLPILRLFAKHASQHPLLPERHGEARTAEQIYRDVVNEMYTHCSRNNLSEVWAYLWNNWYCPNRWPLWARAAYAQSIPRKRTTMIVEALWKNLKRNVLHKYN